MEKNQSEEIILIGFRHYQEWMKLENTEESPFKWIMGSMSVVRSLIGTVYEQDQKIGQKLIECAQRDLDLLKEELKFDFSDKEAL